VTEPGSAAASGPPSGAATDYDALWDGTWDAAADVGPGFRSRHGWLLRLLGVHGVTGRLLEVGAGTGHFLRRAHERFPWLRLAAHEAAPRTVERLRALPWLDGIWEGDLTAPGLLPAGGFHHIVCSEVLEHLDEPEAALDQLVGALRHGGRLFLTVPLRPDLWGRVDEAVGHRRRYRRGELAAACRARGLEIERDDATGFPFYNAYYRAVGARPPRTGKEPGLLTRALSPAVTAIFQAETRFSTPWGARGVVVARLPVPVGSRGR
jgi:SAM-dependent methyltransferase